MKICDCFKLWSGYRVYSMVGNNSVGFLPKITTYYIIGMYLLLKKNIVFCEKTSSSNGFTNPESTSLGLVTLFIPVNVNNYIHFSRNIRNCR